jgi:hypothetical protein
MASFVTLNLVASGHFTGLDLAIPNGRIGWVEWLPRDRHPVTYNGEAEGRLTVHLDAGFDESEAEWIVDVLSALLDLIHGPSGLRLFVARVDNELAPRVQAADVAAGFDILDDRLTAVDEDFWPSDDPIRIALTALPKVIALAGGDHDRALPAALLYYKLSTSEFAFMGDSISWARSDEGHQLPRSAFDRQRVEQAFHNAFKAIEALIGGEPPGNDRRFLERLARAGVDGTELAGFDRDLREPLIDVLKRVRSTRDARAAHAGRTSAARRGITYFELMEAQYAVRAALELALLTVAPATGEPPR